MIRYIVTVPDSTDSRLLQSFLKRNNWEFSKSSVKKSVLENRLAKGLKNSIKEVNDHLSGKIKLRTFEEFIETL